MERVEQPKPHSALAAALEAARADRRSFGARDGALLALLSLAGVTDRDLIELRAEDLDAGSAVLRLRRASEVATIPLTTSAMQALARWLAIRGTAPGHLLHPLARNGEMLRRPISRSLINDTLRRRCRAAGVPTYTPTAVRLAAPANAGTTALAHFLARHGYGRRVALCERLDQLALRFSAGRKNAFTFDWAGLTAEQLAELSPRLEGVGQRQLNALKTALHGVLREGVRRGSISPEVCGSIVRLRWTATREQG